MSTSQTHIPLAQYVTPHPLMPPPTDEKSFTQAPRVIALFRAKQAGKCTKQGPWVEFQLAPGEYDEIERQLGRQEALLGYVKDKIRYDYDANRYRLAVRMPTAIHELLIASVENAILNELKSICDGSDKVAIFARKIHSARSTEIYLPVDGAPLGTKAKHDPDASFCHTDARYPGVIVEVAYSQTRKRLDRLAEDYLLDSNTGIRVVVGLNIEYGKQESRQPTLSVWRTRVEDNEIKVVQEVADEAFRNTQGSSTDHPGLRLQLRDFAYEDLALRELGDSDRELVISTQQLCEYLSAAETRVARWETLVEPSIAPGLTKRKRSKTPLAMRHSMLSKRRKPQNV